MGPDGAPPGVARPHMDPFQQLRGPAPTNNEVNHPADISNLQSTAALPFAPDSQPTQPLPAPEMDALQPKVDCIGGEVSQISEALRAYLEQGFASGRKVQPPRTKAGRDLLQHLLGRLDQVSTGLDEVRKLTVAQPSPSPSPARGPNTPPASDSLAVSQQQPTPPAIGLADHAAAQFCRSSSAGSRAHPGVPFDKAEPGPAAGDAIAAPPLPAALDRPLSTQPSREFRLKDGSVYSQPLAVEHASPLFDCTYQDIHILNEELFELYSSHPVVRDLGYFKLQVRDLPPLNVQKVARPSRDHATSFSYKKDRLGLVKVDTGKRFKFSSPRLPLPITVKMDWSLAEQRELWNSSAADPPKGTRPYIIGNPLFHDVELSPGEKLRRRGRATLEGINTQYVYFNLTGKTITTMHREDAHVRSENLLRSGHHKFWCFVKPAFSKKLEERMALEYPEMRRCSQAVRHLSRHIPPAKLDEWGIEYTLDYCAPGQAIVTEPGTYHQVLNLGPNYAIAINLEYNSSPDMPPDYRFCDRNCPDKFAMSADDFRIYDKQPGEQLPCTPETTGSVEAPAAVPALDEIPELRPEIVQSATPPPEAAAALRGAPLPEPAAPERREQLTPAGSPENGLKLPSPLASQGETAQSQSPVFPRGTPSVAAPDQSVPAAPRPPEGPSLPLQEPSRAEADAPSQPHPTRPGCHGADVSLPRFEPATEGPARMSGPPMPIGSPASASVAYSAQVAPQVSPLNHPHSEYRGHVALRLEHLVPLRKTARMIDPDREDDGSPSPRPSKRQKPEPFLVRDVSEVPAQGALEHLSTLLRGREATRAHSLAADKVSGKPAFERLAHLVREWRRYSRSTPIALGGFGLVKALEETAHGYPELHVFLSRFFKMELSNCVGAAMARPGEVPPQNFMSTMLQSLGWDEAGRSKLHDYLREGKCWATICSGHDGLLCLIPPGPEWLDLALFQDEVARFQAGLDDGFVRKLCAVGHVLQKSIWRCLELPEFIWETTPTTWLPVEQIPPLLEPFRLIKENYYNSSGVFYWPRPVSWDWEWPADPCAVRPGDKPCSLCPRKSCRCAEVKTPQIPRISDDRSKGPGIRSLGTHRANDILGELVGELVPPGCCPGEWTLTLRRPDLDDEPVADIYPRRMGNWVRKVNHSTDPSAMFRVMKISGRWRQMLVAVRDIGDGEEITAKYGKGFTKEQPYSLVEGLH